MLIVTGNLYSLKFTASTTIVVLYHYSFQLVLSQTGAKNLGVIKVMRSLRALRPLRSISLIGGLQVYI